MDRTQETLLDALRMGIAHTEEVRLYRSGKFPGLFPARSAGNAQLANQALTDRLIEMVRSETKGKTTTEWVRVTPAGVQYVLDRESPLVALGDLRRLLEMNGKGLPTWLAELRERLSDLSTRFMDEVDAIRKQIEGSATRVEEALKRIERMKPTTPEGAAGALSWAHDAVEYLEQRQRSSLGPRCPLPELFAQLQKRESGLTLHDFHSGLRRLHDRELIRLFPCQADETPSEPEYLLLDGPNMVYFAAK